MCKLYILNFYLLKEKQLYTFITISNKLRRTYPMNLLTTKKKMFLKLEHYTPMICLKKRSIKNL